IRVGMESERADGEPQRRLSQILTELAQRPDETITVGEIIQALGDRRLATLLVFFAGIHLLPFPPGSTLILGVPNLLIPVQMVTGNRSAWLPGFVLRKSLGAERFRAITARLVPRLERLERLVRPRFWPFARIRGERFLGALAL